MSLAHILSFNHQAWLWATGIEHQPGPSAIGMPQLLRRLSSKQTVPSCPPPPCQDYHQERSSFVQALPEPLPRLPPPPGITIVETKNVTNFEAHADGLASRNADMTFFQEHIASSATMARHAHQFRTKHSRLLHYTSPDPNHTQPCAGVGVVALASDTCLPLEVRCQRLAKFIELGRAQLVAHGKGKAGGLCHWYNVYGYSGSHCNATKAAATDSIIRAVISDHQLRGMARPSLSGTSMLTPRPPHPPRSHRQPGVD